MRTYLEYIHDKSTLLTEAGGVALINVLDRIEKIYVETCKLSIGLFEQYMTGRLETKDSWIQIGLKTYGMSYAKIVGVDYKIGEIGFEKFMKYKDIPLHVQFVPVFVHDQDAAKELYKMQSLANLASGYEETVRAGLSAFNKTSGAVEELYIQVPSVNGIIMRGDFYAAMLHELQHLFQYYTREMTSKSHLNDASVNLLEYIQKNIKDAAFEDIVYHCLDDDEAEAFVVTVFGEILGAGIETPAQFQSFKKTSGTYSSIESVYGHLKKIARMSESEIIKFMEAVDATEYKEHGLGITTRYKLGKLYINVDDYREKLLDYCYKTLDRMEKRILKVVGTYFTRIKSLKKS